MAFNIIEYITKNTDLKQKDIAKKLGVTTGQISKWKQGEYIASERQKELNKLASSMIDLSDGLYCDLGKILSESVKGAWIDVSRLPISETLNYFLGREKSIEKALIGGDDYELCFTVPKIKQNQFDLFAQSNKEIEYTHIGEITSENGLKLLDEGNEYSLTENPYSHF